MVNSLKDIILNQHISELYDYKNDITLPIDIRNLIKSTINKITSDYFVDKNNINISDIKTILYYLSNKNPEHVSTLLLEIFKKDKIEYDETQRQYIHSIIFSVITRSNYGYDKLIFELNRIGDAIYDIEIITENEDNIAKIELDLNYTLIKFKNIRELKDSFTILNPIINHFTYKQNVIIYYKNNLHISSNDDYIKHRTFRLSSNNQILLIQSMHKYYYNFNDMKCITPKDGGMIYCIY